MILIKSVKNHMVRIVVMMVMLALFVPSLPLCVYAAELSDDEWQLKVELENDLMSLENAQVGTEYTTNELMLLCDSFEEAQSAADIYNEYFMQCLQLSANPLISVRDYSYGVAVLTILDPEIISVEGIIDLASDLNNNLPPVYANVCENLESAPLIDYQKHLGAGNIYVNTVNESFTDPNTKTLNSYGTGNNAFQFYHEVIDTKFYWEMLDKGLLKSDSGADLRESLNDVVVAVIDSGAYAGNDLKNCLVGAQCFYPGCESCGATDGHGHGSNVAGIIADAANNINGRGIASGVKIMPLRVVNNSGSGVASNSVRALNYAIQSRLNYEAGIPVGEMNEGAPSMNVRVINMSLGSTVYNTAYAEAIKEAYSAGIVVCCAGGNSDVDILSYPARYDYCMAVTSVNSDYEKANYSCYSSDADISAPGGAVDYDDRMPDNGYMRNEVVYASGCTGMNSVHSATGTSQAAPMVSAVAAILSAKSPSFNVDAIISRIKQTAHPVKGTGLGVGCVNVADAVGISTHIDAPKETVDNERVHFSASNPNSVVYYIEGDAPDSVSIIKDKRAKIYMGSQHDLSTWIDIPEDYTEPTMTISAVSLLYGHLSDVTKVVLNNSHSAPSSDFAIHIEDTNQTATSGKIAAGMILQPKVVRNDYKALPADATFSWSLVNSDDEAYVNIDSVSGLITANNNATIGGDKREIMIRAVCDAYGAAAQMSITLYPISSSLIVRNQQVIISSSTYSLSNNVIRNAADSNCMRMYSVVSDNPAVAKPTAPVGDFSSIRLYMYEAGTANITITALDGSGLAVSFLVTNNPSFQNVYLKSATGKMTYYLGDALGLFAIGNKNIIPDNVTWEIADNPYVDITDDGVVISKNDAPEITNIVYVVVTATAYKSGTSKQSRVCITCLPTPINPPVDHDNPEESKAEDYNEGQTTAPNEYYGPSDDPKIWIMDMPSAIIMQPSGTAIRVYTAKSGGVNHPEYVNEVNTAQVDADTIPEKLDDIPEKQGDYIGKTDEIFKISDEDLLKRNGDFVRDELLYISFAIVLFVATIFTFIILVLYKKRRDSDG